jgi:hypothetical protein
VVLVAVFKSVVAEYAKFREYSTEDDAPAYLLPHVPGAGAAAAAVFRQTADGLSILAADPVKIDNEAIGFLL